MNRLIRSCALLLGVWVSLMMWFPQTHIAAAAPSSAHPSALTRCYTSQLSISPDSSNSGMGHVGFYFRVHNASARACTLFGYPGVQLLNRQGRSLHTVLHWGVGYLSGNQARRMVYLRPGRNAFFFLEWVHFPSPGQTCPSAPAVLITPPNTYRSIRVQMSPGVITACGGVVNAGPVEPSRLP